METFREALSQIALKLSALTFAELDHFRHGNSAAGFPRAYSNAP